MTCRARLRLILPCLLLIATISAAQEPKILRVGITATTTGFDAQDVRDGVTAQVLNNVYDQLVSITAGTTRLEPGLAISWSPSERFTLWTFKMRPNVMFSEGTAATPSIIADSIRRVESISDRCTIVGDDDAGTISFQLNSADAEFPSILAQNYAAVSFHKAGKPYGSGPFVVDPSSTPDHIVLNRSETYWGTPAKVDQIDFAVFKPVGGSFDALRQALIQGKIHLTAGLPIGEIPKLAKHRQIVSKAVVGRSVGMLAFNNERKPFTTAKVRQAIGHAIDRDRIVSSFYPAGTGVARSPVPPTIYRGAKDPWDHNPERARELLAEAGHAEGFSTTILQTWTNRPYAANPAGIALLIQEDLAAVGIKAKIIVPEDADSFFKLLGDGEYDLAVQGWIADTGSPADFLESNLASAMIGTCPACNNMSRYRSDEIDELIRKARATRSRKALEGIIELFNRDLPFVPFVYGPEVAAWSNQVVGFQVSPTPTMYLREVDIR